ncbi:DUF3455 domain-containing protein [Paraburkholderia fungorum]|uniref:DUF3455 domain-containing protein n=1 Tax=Paraburkholderia fungorum TaxID=134537 RepID=A0A420FES4_9BURK|nr:DUF3455 domain-containing protein [Paraburkholderia fungorum]RKF31452.1 hypothetical protein BCY88_11805 [Paraburkholderia fungorum]
MKLFTTSLRTLSALRFVVLSCDVVASSRNRCASQAVRTTSAAALAVLLAACAHPPSAEQIPPANETLPASLRATPQEILQDALTAVGDTTYSCRRSGERLSWVSTGSEATLVDGARQSVGTVAPGRYFTAYDGSYVIGRVAAEEIVTTSALPWQRLTAKFNAGERQGQGRFAKTSSVQRVRTSGGLPPVPSCDQEGMSLFVPYTATYLFYRAAEPAAADAAATPVAEPAVVVSHTETPGTAPAQGQ